ncbi:Brassinosteroid LRR receptor kinase BRL2 [Sesamum alatum]|uniref:non-specific serine/threonine protein kinase n=1 Tax=Sesamum alatum TaxID=300844 RepID=A0AAE1YK36_9LAMI|nr:Brassinosteroid LRR receptor kinase BRL2 [Sesamum alatum]
MSSRRAFSPTSAPPTLQHRTSSSSTRSSPILGGVVIAIVILFVAGWLCFCFRRKLFANFRLWRRQKGKLDAVKMQLRRFRLEELQKATHDFSQSCLVGCGAFGNVYRGTFEAEGTLAIKKLHAESYTSTEEFRNEVKLLSKVKHDNLVGLVGFCEETGPKAAKMLVYEYVTNGSLLDYIMGRGGRSLTWRERARPSIEKGSIEDILDTDLLIQGCNMQMMLKMGQLALRCVVKVPKERPTMTQVWQELEAALKSADDRLLPPQLLAGDSPTLMMSTNDQATSHRRTCMSSADHDYSCSVVSVDGIGLERFHVDIDSMSFQSASLRCLETSVSMDEGFSIIR